MYKFITFITFITLSFLNYIVKADSKSINLIPLPQKVDIQKGEFILESNTKLICNNNTLANYFIQKIQEFTGITIKPDNTNPINKIVLELDNSIKPENKEAYILSITEKEIKIISSDYEGIFRGMQTLFQLIPYEYKIRKDGSPVKLISCIIEDEPRFKWRGLNLDCSRHFMTKDFIKRYIDILAYYKFNTLHWHLTDDQGWRIEIKKYPKLTEIGAWRKEADGSIYGGYYTQEDIKEIIDYAKSRFINIVPEIEMPGHCLASLAAYPENSCTGGPFEVTNLWGVMKDVYCAGRDSTFYFLQDILDEVIQLFPGEYIHIGGDEVLKDRWKECPRCQLRIKQEGLKDEHELQSYFIQRIVNYLQSKNKKAIGWDEILEGGLAKGAIVQSWRGYKGAIDAAKLKHFTICSPTSHTYLNYDPDNLDLQIAYSFEPVPDELNDEEKKFILGGEANLWTEYAPQETVDSKLFPRILALSEVFWTLPENKNYENFYNRLQTTYSDLNALGIQYGRESKIITYNIDYNDSRNNFILTLKPNQKNLQIRYSLNGNTLDSNSPLYKDPIIINKSTKVTVGGFLDGHYINKKIEFSFAFHKALKGKVNYINKYDLRYRANEEKTLTDGIVGTIDFHDGLWQGFEGEDFEVIIDLNSEKEITKVVPRFFLNVNSWIFLPSKVEISLSKDGINFENKKLIINEIPQKTSEILIKDFVADYNKVKARYIKVFAENIKKCPDWHPGAGDKTWLFIDEIIVE
ncbi:glycoside hydrolase family 20 protein [Rosettibacter firmus]|uniref:glycoside hydrolase family 20 protein n=1 Tax=Rosettibacter firmus TaxID=3111522 RepID=UPI00336C297A